MNAAKPDTANDPEIIEVIVRLKSGRFEGSIQMPLVGSKEDKDRFIDSWLSMMQAGLACGAQGAKS